MKKEKMYAKFSDYSKHLVVPVELLDRIVHEGYVVRTGWENNKTVIQEVERVTSVEFISEEELRVAKSVQELKNT